ncbi:type VI secretion protein ClpV [Salmonella bongori]|nr:type VI secretion protein ClpV [Salmonella bongori]
MQTDEAHALRTLVDRMSERVMGQQMALETIAQRLRALPQRPDRSAKAGRRVPAGGANRCGQNRNCPMRWADALYGGERNLITINLSEYQGGAHRQPA